MFGNRGNQVLLIVAFAAAICSTGLTQVIIELLAGQTPQVAELFTQTPIKSNLRAFERDMQNNCWLAQRLRSSMQYARFITLGELPDKAVAGRDGWLFYGPAVQYLIEPLSSRDAGAGQGDIFSAIISFRDQLAERGIKLLVVPVPNKASVYPDMLTKRASRIDYPVNSKTLAIISHLRQAGIEVVDLLAVFAQARTALPPGDRSRYYLLQDSHWSPEGMRLTAQAVGQRILDLRWAEKGRTEYILKPAMTRRHGDILRMIQVPQIERQFDPEQIECAQVINARTNQLYQDDPNSEVLVLGDSFLRIYSQDEPGAAGFVAHLAHELGFALASIVNDGGASTLVRQQLSRNPSLLAHKKVVVWEFVERDIRFGAEGWQIVPLPAPAPIGSDPPGRRSARAGPGAPGLSTVLDCYQAPAASSFGSGKFLYHVYLRAKTAAAASPNHIIELTYQ